MSSLFECSVRDFKTYQRAELSWMRYIRHNQTEQLVIEFFCVRDPKKHLEGFVFVLLPNNVLFAVPFLQTAVGVAGYCESALRILKLPHLKKKPIKCVSLMAGGIQKTTWHFCEMTVTSLVA